MPEVKTVDQTPEKYIPKKPAKLADLEAALKKK